MGNPLQNVMRGAANELRQLRRVNELLEARVRGFDDALALVFARPPSAENQMTAREDYAHQLDQQADLIDHEEQTQK